jgi:hypothetical protein
LQGRTSAKRCNNETQQKREIATGLINSTRFHEHLLRQLPKVKLYCKQRQSKLGITCNESENWFADSATNKVNRSTLNNKQDKIKFISVSPTALRD